MADETDSTAWIVIDKQNVVVYLISLDQVGTGKFIAEGNKIVASQKVVPIINGVPRVDKFFRQVCIE